MYLCVCVCVCVRLCVCFFARDVKASGESSLQEDVRSSQAMPLIPGR